VYSTLISHFASASGRLRPSDPQLGLCPIDPTGGLPSPIPLAQPTFGKFVDPPPVNPSGVTFWVRMQKHTIKIVPSFSGFTISVSVYMLHLLT